MRRTTGVLLLLLVGSNAAWAVRSWRRVDSPSTPATPSQAAATTQGADGPTVVALMDQVRDLEAKLEAERTRPVLAAAPHGTPRAGSAPRPTPTPELEAALRASRDAAEARKRAADSVAAWKADVLQITDPTRREAGLVALEGGMRSSDDAVAADSFRAVYELRDVSYDKKRFRSAVLSGLGHADARVRGAAASAFLQVEREDGDLDRILSVAEAHPEETQLLITAAWMSKNRVEGRLAALYVRALGTEDDRKVMDTANQLRGMWIESAVEDAMLAAWRRTKDASGAGLWSYILGQAVPTREARVAVIFDILRTDDPTAAQLLARGLMQGLDPAAAPSAARLALETLPQAPSVGVRKLCLEVLRRHGGPDQVAGLLAFADNPMVDLALRTEARGVADEMARRR